MKTTEKTRVGLALLGLGAVGMTAATSSQVFAKQFVGDVAFEATPLVKEMVYDPDSQMMIDPATMKPVYENAKDQTMALPTITAGCKDCPKKDD